jgi:transcriptional regulator with XRE-family HTH domain
MPRHNPNVPSSAPPQSFPELLQQVGARIRELRERQGLSLELLGETIGLNAGGMSRIETGKSNFTLRTANRIARGIGVHTREFFVPPQLSELEPQAPKRRGKRAAREPIVLDEDDGSLQELLEHVGSRVRELRELQALSVSVLADYVGVMPHALSSIEAGKTNLTIRTADRIAQGIGVYTHELFIPRERSEIQPSSKSSTATTATAAKKAKAKRTKKGADSAG